MTNRPKRTAQHTKVARKTAGPRARRRPRCAVAHEATTAAVLVSAVCTAIGSVDRMLGVLMPHLR